MNEILFESMEFIDDSYLEKSEKKTVGWRKWTAVAAGFCVIIFAAYMISIISNPIQDPNNNDQNDFPIDNVNNDPDLQIPDAPPPPDDYVPPVTPTDPDKPQIPVEDDKPVEPGVPAVPNTPAEPDFLPDYLFDAVYNDVGGVVSASMPNIPHYFTEELSESELKILELIFKEDWMDFSGVAGFDGEGDLLDVRMSTPTTVPGVEIQVAVSKVLPMIDYVFDSADQISQIGSVEVKMYRWEQSDTKIFLEVRGVIDRANMVISVVASKDNEEAVKADLETLVYLYAYWFNSDRLDEIKAETIPEYRNDRITLSESYNDEDFGAYMPKVLPDGFAEESVRRYKNYLLNYLSGLWTKGLAQIDWEVSYMSEDDENRLTSVEAVENYDLSLYPIPMAQSVPDELREIVNHPIFDINELTLDVIYARSRVIEEAGDVSGYRTSFDVRFGDIVVRISTKGVDPEWIFDALSAIK